MSSATDESVDERRSLRHALALAATIGAGDEARIQLTRDYLGNAARTSALRAAILKRATREYRDLFARTFRDSDGPDAWALLFAIAARFDRRRSNGIHQGRRA